MMLLGTSIEDGDGFQSEEGRREPALLAQVPGEEAAGAADSVGNVFNHSIASGTPLATMGS